MTFGTFYREITSLFESVLILPCLAQDAHPESADHPVGLLRFQTRQIISPESLWRLIHHQSRRGDPPIHCCVGTVYYR
jgi:hypothetical protein